MNDAPVAYNDTYTTLEDVPLIVPRAAGILTNDVDVDGDALTAVARDQRHPRDLDPQHERRASPTRRPTTTTAATASPIARDDGVTTGNVATVTIIVLGAPRNSVPRLLSGFQLQLSGPPASTYIIQASTNLRDWTPISTNSGLTGSVVFTDTNAANFSQRFYRALALLSFQHLVKQALAARVKLSLVDTNPTPDLSHADLRRLSGPRMKFPVHFPQPASCHVRVNLRRADVRAGRAIPGSPASPPRAPAEWVAKAVPQHVRRDIAGNTGASRATLDVQPQRHRRERRAALRQKNICR